MTPFEQARANRQAEQIERHTALLKDRTARGIQRCTRLDAEIKAGAALGDHMACFQDLLIKRQEGRDNG